MAFQTPTFEEQAAFCVAHFKALFPEDDVSATSFNLLWLLTIAAAVTDNHAHIDATKNDLLPDTAEGSELERWAKIRGVTKKGATPARKAKALRVAGTPGTTVPIDAELVHESDGLRFKTASAANIPAIGWVDIDIVALDTGSKTRLPAHEILKFTALPSPNLEESNELQLALDEDGDDAESDGALRLRVLSRFSNPPLGGAQEDYVQWALAQTGYAAAFCYPIRAGLGSVDLAALHAGSGSVRAPSDAEVAALQAIIDELRPVSVRAFRVLKVNPEAVGIEVTIVPNGEAQYAFDWNDVGPPTVSAWNAGTRKLTFTGGVRPASIIPGHRLIVKDADPDVGTGKERVVESLDGADAVILEDDPDGDVPAAGQEVYSGGPLVEPVRAAIQALVDSLGTANPDSKRYGAWEGNLRPSAIGRVATDVEGVLDGTVLLPVATTSASDPAYPDDDEVGLLIAGRIIVRKQA